MINICAKRTPGFLTVVAWFWAFGMATAHAQDASRVVDTARPVEGSSSGTNGPAGPSAPQTIEVPGGVAPPPRPRAPSRDELLAYEQVLRLRIDDLRATERDLRALDREQSPTRAPLALMITGFGVSAIGAAPLALHLMLHLFPSHGSSPEEQVPREMLIGCLAVTGAGLALAVPSAAVLIARLNRRPHREEARAVQREREGLRVQLDNVRRARRLLDRVEPLGDVTPHGVNVGLRIAL